jgi:hypothetical protein
MNGGHGQTTQWRQRRRCETFVLYTVKAIRRGRRPETLQQCLSRCYGRGVEWRLVGSSSVMTYSALWPATRIVHRALAMYLHFLHPPSNYKRCLPDRFSARPRRCIRYVCGNGELDTSKLQLTFTARPSIRICRTRDWRRQWHPIRWHRRGWPFGRLPLPERRRCAIGTARQGSAIGRGEEDTRAVRRIREEGLHWRRPGVPVAAARKVGDCQPQHQEAHIQAAGT